MTAFHQARKVLHQAISARVFPGAAFGVLHHGEIAALESVGGFRYEEDASPVLADTIFDVSSLTKVQATTALAMRLWQNGALALDTPLVELLPAFAGDDPRRNRVTLSMLLSHTSGLPGYARLYELPEVLQASSAVERQQRTMHACLTMALNKDPGERAEYSDIGFILLGEALRVLAQASSLQELLADQVFRDLGMNDTGYLPPKEWRPRIAPTGDWNWRHCELQGEVQDENCSVLSGVAGHAGVFSNCPDILKFAGEVLRPSGFFDPRTVEHFARRVSGSRALGWDTPSSPSQSGRYFSPRSIGHLGYTGTSLWIDLDQDIAITLLTNRTYTGPAAAPMEDPAAIQRIRPAFHDAVMRELLSL